MDYLKLESSALNLDWSEVEKTIERFIRKYVKDSGRQGLVLGLSGGVDSCTCAALSALSIGGDKVLGLLLPEEETYSTEDIDQAMKVARKFGFRTEITDITSVLEVLCKSVPIFESTDKLSKGNMKARTRMLIWYYYANRLHALVCGCSNKSEAMVGYFTKWGDIAADISPIMDLYKTQVRQLAEHIGVPKEIATKPASPNLWPGQLAEKELGTDYETLDLILYGLERFMKTEEIAQHLGVKKELINEIRHRWLSMEHKRRMPLTVKIQYRTIGADFRLPRTSLGT